MSRFAEALAILHASNPHIAVADPLLRLAGRPLIAHGILAAKAATSIGRVSVALEDPAVTAFAASLGAGVFQLPAPLTTPDDILAETLDRLRRENEGPEIVVFIDYRLPLTQPEDIDGAVAALIAANADCAIAATSVSGTLWRAGDGGAEAWAEALPPACVETGAVFAVRTARYAERARRAALERMALYLMPAERAVAVHQPFPLAVVETLMAVRARSDRLGRLPRKPAALVMDFDGVFTDNRVLVDETGREAVLCNRSDGLGLEQLRAYGLPMLVLSKEQNPVVRARCRKLKLECLQGVDDKRPALEAWCRERRLPLPGVIYIGNDTNDLACFEAVGCAVAVADAHEDAVRAADVILAQDGGRGALRELTDLIAARLTSAG